MVYFIFRLKLANHRLRIVNHTETLEHAIEMVKTCARSYMNKKNQSICDQTTSQSINQNNVKYLIETHPDNGNIINVIKETTTIKPGWVSTDIVQDRKKIAIFSYSKYNFGHDPIPKTIELPSFEDIPPPPISRIVPRVQKGGNGYMNEDLKHEMTENPLFQNLRKNADENDILNREEYLLEDDLLSSFEEYFEEE